MKSKPLSKSQIQRLSKQLCTAEDWKGVSIRPGCDLSRIQKVHFLGRVSLGSNGGVTQYRGLNLPCGIYDATIGDCVVGDNVRISRIRTGIFRYHIEDGALLEDIGILSAEPSTRFGNGTEVDVVNEAGGRGTMIYGRLTAQVGYMNALFRHNPPFIKQLKTLAENEITDTVPKVGVIGRGATVVACAHLHNILVGPYARIEGAARLEDGTISSCKEDPTFIGSGVQAREFVVAEGAKIDSSALLDKVFVGQGVRVGKQYSAENSLLFANSEAFHGEGVAMFAGPYTVTHHKSTLMIAGLFSFFNAGSGTNQSNHLYKLGPVHQGIFERGCKTGSSSYVLLESHIGAFSLVVGKHIASIDSAMFPFSYIIEKAGESSILPGANLISVGTVRDGEKWPKRDNRKVKEKRDLIIFDIFSPYTVERMRRGRDELLLLNEAAKNRQMPISVAGVHVSPDRIRKGVEYYQAAITRYLYGKVLMQLTKLLARGGSWEAVLLSLRPTTGLKHASDWTDIAGLLGPLETFRNLEDQVASGKLKTYDDLLTQLKRVHRDYPLFEWQYVTETFEKEAKDPLVGLTREAALRIVDEWQKAALAIHSLVLEDSRKEFGQDARIGYGLDLSEKDIEADFAAVRGTMETNSTVLRLVEEEKDIARRAADFRAKLASFR